MNPTTRLQILQRLHYDYLRASNLRAKGVLLDDAQRLLSVGRKYLIRFCNRPTDSRPPKPRTGRPVRYGPAVKAALKDLWLVMDQPCSSHLKAGLAYWIPSWESSLLANLAFPFFLLSLFLRSGFEAMRKVGVSAALRFRAITAEGQSSRGRSGFW
jgi:hypothetical protein